MNKICTSIEQSKKLIELGIDVNTADMFWDMAEPDKRRKPLVGPISDYYDMEDWAVPAWSLTALLKYLSEIKPQVYTQVLFPSEGKWILQFVEYGNGNVCEVSCDNPVDACVTLIEKLHKLKML